MPTNAHVAHTQVIPFPADRLWRVLTDYRVHHPAILPTDVFKGLVVLQGGTGAGTRFRLTMRMAGKDHVSEISVTEPKPGSVLVEAADDGSVVTTFSLEPIDGGRATRLTFDTDYTLPGGLLLPLMRWMTNKVLGGLYMREMDQLTAYLNDGWDRNQPG